MFSAFQGLLILARRKRFRDGDIVLAVSLAGRGFGNIVFSVTGLDDYGDILSDSDLVCVQRCPEKVSVGFLVIPSVAKISPSTVWLL